MIAVSKREVNYILNIFPKSIKLISKKEPASALISRASSRRFDFYWTVTDLAKFRGLSTSKPFPRLV